MLVKIESRVEALFFVYFLALLVQALIARALRRAMERGVSTNCRSIGQKESYGLS